MNYYFFPLIGGFDSSITLVNFPSLDRLPSIKQEQFVYVTWSDGRQWHYRKIDTIQFAQAKEYKHSELPKDIPASPFLFFHYAELPPTSEELILSNHMHVMPTWRGNIKVFSDYTSTSYAGDYQYEMIAHIKKGSLVSLSPMFQNNPEFKNSFVFINIQKSPKIESHIMKFYDPKRDKILFSAEVKNNTCNVVDLANVDIPSDTPVLSVSDSIAGIPIYLSYSSDRKSLSFEHTHPPASLVVFGEPLYFQRKFKEHWLHKVKEAELATC